MLKFNLNGEFLTVAEIAKRENVKTNAIYHRLRRTGSPVAHVKHAKHIIGFTRTKTGIKPTNAKSPARYEYNGQSLTILEIATIEGLTWQGVRNRINRHGVPYRRPM